MNDNYTYYLETAMLDKTVEDMFDRIRRKGEPLDLDLLKKE